MPFCRTSKCRCGPVERPVEPTAATRWPRSTRSPSFTNNCDAWSYRLTRPLPWSISSILPYWGCVLSAAMTLPPAAATIKVTESAWQFMRLQAGELGEPLAQAVEAQHPRLQIAQMNGHGVQVSLHQLFFLVRLVARVDEHPRL